MGQGGHQQVGTCIMQNPLLGLHCRDMLDLMAALSSELLHGCDSTDRAALPTRNDGEL